MGSSLRHLARTAGGLGALLAASLVVSGAGARAEPAANDAAAAPSESAGKTGGTDAGGAPAKAADKATAKGGAGETIDQAICRLIEGAAKAEGIPTSFFTRLIWRESSFRPDVVSHAGAQGIAQFMPGTAKARGLENPFDPAAAIPASAKLLADLNRQFGNLGLAAAAYNAGPGRVNGFLAGGGLPGETRTYVKIITGQTAEQWAALKKDGGEAPAIAEEPCLVTVAALRQGAPPPAGTLNELFAPWGVQLSGNFSRDIALASFRRQLARYGKAIADQQPMIIATKLGGRGSRVFYRVRLPAETRADAMRLCDRLRKAGGACLVLPN